MKLGKQLTLDMIDSSIEISDWLEQFAPGDLNTAKSLLSHLVFISKDEFSEWLINKFREYRNETIGVYSIRKFKREEQQSLWNSKGKVELRPAESQGSEDFVSSIMSNIKKKVGKSFLDTPSLAILKKNKVRRIILVDDSIGSGKRVSDFIQRMTNNKTFMSWWSGGYIKITVLSYARSIQAENRILNELPGSNYKPRKIPIKKKINFNSDIVYELNNIQKRWGDSAQEIKNLCLSNIQITDDYQLGYGKVMSNIIFCHSVPNNIPGLLFIRNKKWTPLFFGRAIPEWLPKLIKNEKLKMPNEMFPVLMLIKAGIRKTESIASRLDFDINIIENIITQARNLGFLSIQNRLHNAGKQYIIEKQGGRLEPAYDYSLYIPKNWSVDQVEVQPSFYKKDSVGVKSMEGDVSSASLERTEAMSTLSTYIDKAH